MLYDICWSFTYNIVCLVFFNAEIGLPKSFGLSKRFGDFFVAHLRPAELEVSVDNTKPGITHARFQILSSHGLTCPKMRLSTKIWACLGLIVVHIDLRQAKLSDQRLCADPNCSGESTWSVLLSLIQLKVAPQNSCLPRKLCSLMQWWLKSDCQKITTCGPARVNVLNDWMIYRLWWYLMPTPWPLHIVVWLHSVEILHRPNLNATTSLKEIQS